MECLFATLKHNHVILNSLQTTASYQYLIHVSLNCVQCQASFFIFSDYLFKQRMLSDLVEMNRKLIWFCYWKHFWIQSINEKKIMPSKTLNMCGRDNRIYSIWKISVVWCWRFFFFSVTQSNQKCCSFYTSIESDKWSCADPIFADKLIWIAVVKPMTRALSREIYAQALLIVVSENEALIIIYHLILSSFMQ